MLGYLKRNHGAGYLLLSLLVLALVMGGCGDDGGNGGSDDIQVMPDGSGGDLAQEDRALADLAPLDLPEGTDMAFLDTEGDTAQGDGGDAVEGDAVLPDGQAEDGEAGMELQVSLATEPSGGVAPLDVHFASTVVGGQAPYLYDWDFGDESGPNGSPAPNHTYSAPGTYLAQLTVQDPHGLVGQASVEVLVQADSLPEAEAFADPARGVAPLIVSFQGWSSGGNAPLTTLWTFGDGATSPETSVSHTFNDPGSYTARFLVEDEDGDQTSAEVEVVVEENLTVAVEALADPPAGLAGLTEVHFSSTVIGGNAPVALVWDLGNGDTRTEPSFRHIYAAPGSYTVTLTATDGNGDVAMDQQMVVMEENTRPLAAAAASVTEGRWPLLVHFTGTAEGGNAPLTYSWSFGDGSTGEGSSAGHTFEGDGQYTVILTVTDVDGQKDQADPLVIVVTSNTRPDARATANPVVVPVGMAVQFTCQMVSGDEPFSFEWTFGDGERSFDQNPVHAYTTEGTMPVGLLVTDVDGETITDSLSIRVEADEEPSVLAIASVTTGIAPLQVAFFAEASGGNGLLQYLWDFGDTQTSHIPEPIHVYGEGGVFNAIITVTDEDGDIDQDSVTILVDDDTIPALLVQAQPSRGAVPLEVAFSAVVTEGNPPYIFQWTFGDGTAPSAEQNPNHLYDRRGTFEATVTVRDGNGDTNLQRLTITAEAPTVPLAQLSADLATGVAPLEVAFTAQAIGGNGEISYLLDFGDGDVSDQPEATHTYEATGTYIATLTVTDEDGESSEDTVTIEVVDDRRPVVLSITATPTSGIQPLMASFVAEVAGGNGQLTYLWDFGDGDFSDVEEPTHVFADAGVFIVSLMVADEDGDEGRSEVAVEVDADLTLEVEIEAEPSVGAAPLLVNFSANILSGNPPYRFEPGWDFGDGTTSQERNPQHEYTTEGTYFITLSLLDADGEIGEAQAVVMVDADSIPVAYITAHPLTGAAPLTVTLEGRSEGGNELMTYQWDFGDGFHGEGVTVDHTFLDVGLYTTELTITDQNGDVAQTTQLIEVVEDLTPTLEVTATPTSGALPLSVSFQSTVTGGNGASALHWDFGDGDTSEENNPVHVYETLGLYTVQVVATDEDGDTHTQELSIEVLDDDQPLATAEAFPSRGIAPVTVRFMGQALGGNPPHSFAWDLGDGSTAQEQNPEHTYTDVGTYVAILTVTDSDGDTAEAQVVINAETNMVPTLVVQADPASGPVPLEVALEAMAEGGNGELSYLWNFGDGSQGMGDQATHTYLAVGTYTAQVTVTDEDGDTAQGQVEIQVGDDLVPEAIALADPVLGIAPLTVMLTGQASGGNPPLLGTWDFGDGEMSPLSQPIHIYQAPGRYVATYTVTDTDGDSDSAQVVIEATTDMVPQLTVSAQPPLGAAPLHVSFQADVAAGNPPFIISWDLGDGTVAEGPTVEHDYPDVGHYLVQVTVTDSDGDTDEESIEVIVADDTAPTVVIQADPSTGLAPLAVNLSLTVEGGNLPLTYLWDIQGQTYTEAEISHVFPDPGTYTVLVTVTDQDGDTATDQRDIEVIQDQTPTITVSLDPAEGLGPLKVNLQAQVAGGNGALTVAWELGDGHTATGEQVVHTYERPGLLTLSATVTDEDGDLARAFATVDVAQDRTPSLSLDVSPSQGLAPLDVTLTGNVSGGNGPSQVTWSINHGSPIQGGEIETTLSAPGTYMISATAVDEDGDMDSAMAVIQVDEDEPAHALISANRSVGPAPLTVLFEAVVTSGNGPFLYEWDFAGEGVSNEANPSHIFRNQGIYTVGLTVIDQDGDTAQDSMTVQVGGVAADIVIQSFDVAYVLQSDEVIYQILVANLGQADAAPFDVGLFFHRAEAPGVTHGADHEWSIDLEVGASILLEHREANPPGGLRQAWALADMGQVVPEQNRANNLAGPESVATPLAGIIINEVYYDDPDPEDQAFIELAGPAGTVLTGCVLRGIDGQGGGTYLTLPLDDVVIGPSGLAVVAQNPLMPADLVVPSLALPDGPDSLVLECQDGFGSLRDAVGYGVFGRGVTFAGEGQAAPDPVHLPIGRLDLQDTNNNAVDFVALGRPTPGAPNVVPGDVCGQPLLIGGSGSYPADLTSALDDTHSPDCLAGQGVADLMYQLVVVAESSLDITLPGGTALSLRADCQDESSEMICSAQAGAPVLHLPTIAPGTYTLVAEGEGVLGLEVSILPLAPNDGCGTVHDLPLGLTVRGDTSSLFHKYSASCGPNTEPDAVYRITLDRAGTVTVRVEGLDMDFDTVLYVQSTCGGSDTEIACNDDSGAPFVSQVTLNDLAPGSYYVIVDGLGDLDGDMGPFDLRADLVPSDGGTCQTAPALAEGTTQGDTSTSLDDLASQGCGEGSSGPDLAYRLSLAQPSDILLAAFAQDLSYDPVLYVQATCDDPLSEVACVDDAVGPHPLLVLRGLAPDDYTVIVDGYRGSAGPFDLMVQIAPAGQALEAVLIARPTMGPAPLAVELRAEALGGQGPYTYHWNLGDGSTSDDQSLTYTYEGVGSYGVNLTVTDSLGQEALGSQLIRAQ